MDIPVYKPVSKIRMLPQWIAIVLISSLLYFSISKDDIFTAILIAIIVTLAYRYLIRYTIMRNNVKGIRLLKKSNIDGAIECFQQVNLFFLKHKTLDKYGFIIFLSPTKYSYRELALVNLAYSYAQKGDISKAKEYYAECLKINPQNGIAISSMNFIKASENRD